MGHFITALIDLDMKQDLDIEINFDGGEKDIKQIIAFALDYCQQHGIEVTTEQVFSQLKKDIIEST